MTVESFAEDTANVLTHFGYESAHVVGHSAGAYNAVNFAQMYPERTKKVILVTPCILPMPELYPYWTTVVRNTSMEDLLNNFYYPWLGANGKAGQSILDVIRADTEAHEHRREEQARFHEVALQQFEFKTLHGAEAYIIMGKEDSVTVPEQCIELCEYIKAKPITLEEGHYQPLENPKALAKTILSIISVF